MSVPRKRCHASVPKSKKSKKVKHSFGSVVFKPWYSTCKELGDRLKTDLEELNENLRTETANNVIEFVKNYKYSIERVPFIALLTGVDLSDQERLFSVITNRIQNKNHLLVFLNDTKTATLKSLVEDTVFNLLTNWDSKKETSSMEADDEENTNPIKKSDCTFHSLANWYKDNYGSDLNSTSVNQQITYLIIVIPNISLFPKEILNSFVQLLSVHRKYLPFILLAGVPTTRRTIHKTFSKDVESRLAIYPFQSPSLMIFLDKVLENIFLTSDCVFQLGSKAFQTLTHSFLNYHLSVSELSRGIQFCLKEHFSQSNCSIVGCNDENIMEKINLLKEDEINRLLQLDSMQKYNKKLKMGNEPELEASSPRIKEILKDLHEEFRCKLNRFHLTLLCLNAVLKFTPENSLPIYRHYIELMNPERRMKWLTEKFMLLKFFSKEALLETLNCVQGIISNFSNDDENICEINSKISSYKENIEKSQLISIKNSPAKSPSKINFTPSNRAELKNTLLTNAQKQGTRSEFDEAKAEFLLYFQNDFIKVYLKSIDDAPLRELFIFEDENESKLKFYRGIPMAGISTALSTPISCLKSLQCECCDQVSADAETSPDLALVHQLHKECGNKINMYDWFQQFRSKIEKLDFTDNEVDPEIYSRFLRAVRELHYLGFITLPKSRVNFVEYATKLTE